MPAPSRPDSLPLWLLVPLAILLSPFVLLASMVAPLCGVTLEQPQ